MRIGFDRQAFIMQKYGGISRYYSDLYLGLRSHAEVKADLLFKRHYNAYLWEHNIGQMMHPIAAKYYIKFLTKARIGHRLARNKDIHHSTYYLGIPKKINSETKLVSTLYDMIPELMPSFFERNPHVNKLYWFNASDLIISISDSATADLVNLRPELASRIHRIHLYSGFNTDSPQSKPAGLAGHEKPYLLFVGNRAGYKNAAMLLKAFSASEPSRQGHQLVFAGGGAFNTEELTEIDRMGISAHVKQIDVNDSELWYLYQNAKAVLVPSMAEGFSLPLVEGLAGDVPVVCSDIPVHREIAGAFATFVNAKHYADWVDILGSVGKLKRPSKILGKSLYSEQRRYFSKERMVSEHVKAYCDLMG